MNSKCGVGVEREGASPRRDEWGRDRGDQHREESRERKGKRFRWGGGHLEGDKGRKIPKKEKTQTHTPANTPPHTDEGASGTRDGSESVRRCKDKEE